MSWYDSYSNVVICSAFTFLFLYTTLLQHCPAHALEADITILSCVAGDGGNCPTPALGAETDQTVTLGAAYVAFPVPDVPVTYLAEFSCCPVKFPGLESDK